MDVNCKDSSRQTALVVAVRFNSLEAGRELLAGGAEPNCCDPKSLSTPLHLLLDRFNPRPEERRRQTLDLVDDLMDRGAKPKTPNKAGEAPVHVLARTNDVEVISKFASHVPEEEAEELLCVRTSEGLTLVHYAAGKMDETGIHTVLVKGANLVRTSATYYRS